VTKRRPVESLASKATFPAKRDTSGTLADEARLLLQVLEESIEGEPKTAASKRPPRSIGIPFHLGLRGVSWWFTKRDDQDSLEFRAQQVAFEFEQIAAALRRGEVVDGRLLGIVDETWLKWNQSAGVRDVRVALITALDFASGVTLPPPWNEYPAEAEEQLRAQLVELLFDRFAPTYSRKLKHESLRSALKRWNGVVRDGSPLTKWQRFDVLLSELGLVIADTKQTKKDASRFRKKYR
jgi:hypothetical protein